MFTHSASWLQAGKSKQTNKEKTPKTKKQQKPNKKPFSFD